MGYLTDTVNYKGIQERYNTGTPADYNEWLSDDGATDDFEGTMDHFGAITKAKKKATKRAKKEYERREKNTKQRDSNEQRIGELQRQLSEQNNAASTAAAKAQADKEAAEKQMQDAQADSRMSAQQQYQQRVDNFENPNASVKQQIADIQARSPFGNSFMGRIGQAQGQTQGDDKQPLNQSQMFADKYKLDLISSGATKSEKSKDAFLTGR